MRDIVIGKDPWNPRQRYALERADGRPSQGGGHAVPAWRPTCRAGRCEPLLASREPPSKAQGEDRGERSNTAERPPGNTAREPARAEPNVNTEIKHLTNTTQESMMPSSAQPPILWADQGTCPIPAEPTQSIIIEDDVWIGSGAIILQGIRVGAGAVIAAGSVVTRDIPAWTLVAGVPGEVKRYLGD